MLFPNDLTSSALLDMSALIVATNTTRVSMAALTLILLLYPT